MFVIYNIETTRYLRVFRSGCWDDARYETVGAAKAALTRELKKGKFKPGEYGVADMDAFRKIEKTVVVKNLMSGKDVVQSVNTPRCCNVSSELYWTM